MQLSELVGEYYLSGVEFGTVKNEDEYASVDKAATVDFILSKDYSRGHIYSAIEDPSDSYRSSLRNIEVDREGAEVKNRFAPVKVIGVLRTDPHSDILDLIDTKNNKVVLSIGTSNTDDYYPCFIGTWTPENLSVNEPFHEYFRELSNEYTRRIRPRSNI